LIKLLHPKSIQNRNNKNNVRYIFVSECERAANVLLVNANARSAADNVCVMCVSEQSPWVQYTVKNKNNTTCIMLNTWQLCQYF
jgi:hypothetical protein